MDKDGKEQTTKLIDQQNLPKEIPFLHHENSQEQIDETVDGISI